MFHLALPDRMNRFQSFLESARRSHLAAGLVALAGVAAYLTQTLYYARVLDSILDEGSYLYKGLLFVRGVYAPYQDYGPLTNKMPLAFILPGLVQDWFGPGLRHGRLFAIVLSISMLLAIWLVTRRLGGRWWAAAAVWVLAANPGLIRHYSQALSEGLIAAMLAWVFVLVLGADRPLWQVIAGSVLSALAVLTRENMLPVVAFVVLYVWWERGWRFALASAGSVLAVLLVVHLIYWPDIMSNWARPLPAKLTPFLNAWREKIGGTGVWKPDMSGWSRLYSFWDGMRLQFAPVFGMFATWLLLPRRDDWKPRSHFRITVALSALLVVLTVAHMWASLLEDSCVFCFNLYMAFFGFIGLIIVAASGPSWRLRPSVPRQVIALLFALIYFAGVGVGAHQYLDDFILNIKIPRTRNLRILPGTTDLWRSLYNKFGLSFEVQQRLLPVIAGVALAALVIILVLGVVWVLRRKRLNSPAPGYLVLVVLLALGALLSPTPIFGYVMDETPCRSDVISAYEQAGAVLAENVPPGALVYWRGGLSPAPLLYIPQARIFPPQLNDGYTLREGGDPDRLYRMGFWNQELARQWLAEADYVLVEDNNFSESFRLRLQENNYEEVARTGMTNTCRAGTEIRIFRRHQ